MPRPNTFQFLAALILLLASGAILRGQSLADRVPADAILYVGWNGVESPGAGYQGSNLQAVLKNSKIPQLCEQFLPQLVTALGKQDRDAAAQIAVFQSLMGPMWRHPSAIAFNGIDGNAPNGPAPRLVLMCQAGAESADLKKQFEDLTRMAQGTPFPINVIQKGDLLALVVGYDKPESALAGAAGGNGASLAGEASFTGALAHTRKGAFFTGYVDVEKLVALVDKFAPSAGMEVQEGWPKVRDALGIAGVTRAIWTEGFEGKEWGTNLFIAASKPGSGLVGAMFVNKPLGDDVYKLIPQNATLAGATFFDVGGLLTNIRAAVANFDPDSAKQIDQTLEQISQAIGVNVQNDLLASFGDQWAYYTDPSTFGNGLAGITVVNRVKNPETLENALAKLEDFANEQAAAALKQESGPKFRFGFRREKVGNATIHFLAFPAITPAWAIADGNLYLALYPEVISAATARAAGGGKSLLDNPGFAAFRQKLAARQITSFDYADLPRLAPNSYGSWLAISRLAGIGDLMGVPSPINILPPLDTLTPNLTPSGQVTWTDADGFHMRAMTPFPGADLLVSDPSSMSTAQMALMTSIMLPALNRAREMANRVKSASNLRQIGLGAMMYANGHNGAFPNDFGQMMKEEDLSIDVFLNPRSSNELPTGLTPEQQQQWVKEKGDYVWNGAGKNNATPADVPIGWERPQGLSDGINILFGDAHVDFVPMGKAMEMIQNARPANNPPARSGRVPPASRNPGTGL